MKCEIIKDLIPLYCDGLCSGETRAAVEEHIARCEDCRKQGMRRPRQRPRLMTWKKRWCFPARKSLLAYPDGAVIIAIIAVVAVMAAAGAAAYHFYWPTHHHYPKIVLHRMDSMADPRFESEEYYAEWIGISWAGDPKTDKKVRELVLWNHIVDLELHYVYTAPYDVRVSGEVKGGKTTLRYEGYVTTQDGETIEYKNEMVFDSVFGPKGELFTD